MKDFIWLYRIIKLESSHNEKSSFYTSCFRWRISFSKWVRHFLRNGVKAQNGSFFHLLLSFRLRSGTRRISSWGWMSLFSGAGSRSILNEEAIKRVLPPCCRFSGFPKKSGKQSRFHAAPFLTCGRLWGDFVTVAKSSFWNTRKTMCCSIAKKEKGGGLGCGVVQIDFDIV